MIIQVKAIGQNCRSTHRFIFNIRVFSRLEVNKNYISMLSLLSASFYLVLLEHLLTGMKFQLGNILI